jgi:hypothetical protein
MKILFVSNSPRQTVITVDLERKDPTVTEFDFETHLYNHDGGYTELWSVSPTYDRAGFMHKQLCQKCGIKVNM